MEAFRFVGLEQWLLEMPQDTRAKYLEGFATAQFNGPRL
uniref:Uncharacterized protein n=1 Tax=Curvibacter symbiont subsp. Hydra magnipapillata TaxID=667019 RepID=C9Y931_CURXX|nr:hypothetical protein Csp_A06320 [Curvibacter putative symbiont of Hydra magnipapillata]